MQNKDTVIREISADDLQDVQVLVQQTARRYVWDPLFTVMSAEEIGEEYLGDDDNRGYVAVIDSEIKAFMGVSLTEGGSGFIRYGVDEQYNNMLITLLKQCESFVQARGGSKVSSFSITRFGQIRNKEISMLEQLGFESDEYATTSALLFLNNWREPDHLDTTNIVPITGAGLDVLQQMLMDDGDSVTRVQWKSTSKAFAGTVAIALQAPSGEIQGFAHYKVARLDPVGNPIKNVNGFALHFRPQFELALDEKRRLLRAALSSMKQLGICNVATNMRLNDFQLFVLLATEGFDEFVANVVRLTKVI
ncbi:hypothetical protein H8B09_11200 [Paenibacillus sp. PR3]|uniref:N-acetyltransferase domain-containing protein n=1 Tax=Paenibacillus terricola TaxID=2763503 RepID=A0ABR8MTQ2_9BACL|nr:hypothetical protein [Paenibacillus terricola]MBD3919322.1 hypothetical protein [Paenibacillus terricola]